MCSSDLSLFTLLRFGRLRSSPDIAHLRSPRLPFASSTVRLTRILNFCTRLFHSFLSRSPPSPLSPVSTLVSFAHRSSLLSLLLLATILFRSPLVLFLCVSFPSPSWYEFHIYGPGAVAGQYSRPYKNTSK